MGKPFSLADYLRRQAGTLAWRCVAIVFFGGIALAGPSMLNSVLAKSEFAKANTAAIAAAVQVAQDASKAAAEASTKADQLILTQAEIIKTQAKIFDELHAQGTAQAATSQSVAVIGEDVKAIQGQLTRDESQIDERH